MIRKNIGNIIFFSILGLLILTAGLSLTIFIDKNDGFFSSLYTYTTITVLVGTGLFSIVLPWVFIFNKKGKTSKTINTDKPNEPHCTTCRFGIGGKYGNCWVGTHYADQGLDRTCIKGELWEGRVKVDTKIKTCKQCKADVTDEHYGEQNKLGMWVYWCPKCYKADFISMVNSNPAIRRKYIGIYGNTPEQVLNK